MLKQGVLTRVMTRVVSRVLRLDVLEARVLEVSACVWRLGQG